MSVSLVILFCSRFTLPGLRSHSLSGESLAMRQDFELLYPSGSPAPPAANPAAASPFSSAPRPRILDGTSIPSCLPANSSGISSSLPASILPSAQSRKNSPPPQFLRAPPVRARLEPKASTPLPARPASSPPRFSVFSRTLAPSANSIPPAQFESPQSSAASPAAAQFQIIPATCARACARRDASAQSPRRALLDLRVPLPLHFPQHQPASHLLQKQTLRPACKLSLIVQQARDRLPVRHRCAIAQVQVHTQPQPRRLPRDLQSARKRRPVRQHGCARHDADSKRIRNPAVHPLGPAEVIRIHNQILQSLSFSRSAACSLVQLLFRAPARTRTIDSFSPQL